MSTEVAPFKFGRSESAAPATMPGLDRMGERLARLLRVILEPYVGGRPVVDAKPIEHSPFLMWDACVPAFTSLSLYRIAPIKGTVVLRMDAMLVSTLVDLFYGGPGDAKAVERSEFSPTEDRFIARISGQIMTALTQVWADHATLDIGLIGRETGLGQAVIADSSDDMVIQAFEVVLSDTKRYTIEVVYPLDGLRGIEPPGGVRVHDDVRRTDPVWQARLARQVRNVRLPARTVLARPNVTMSELMALKPGDVIPVHIARSLPLIVGDRIFAHGTIGEQDGRAAFLIEKLA
jgi:flagellar motor switch protein FliM